SPRDRHTLLQEIPNLDQQCLILGQWRRSRRFFLFGLHKPAEKLDDEEKDSRRDKEKVDHLPEEQPVRDLFAMYHELPGEIALLAWQQHADERHEEVLDQGVDELAKGRPNDHRDGQIDDIAFEGELFGLNI